MPAVPHQSTYHQGCGYLPGTLWGTWGPSCSCFSGVLRGADNETVGVELGRANRRAFAQVDQEALEVEAG